jgi:omega-hydroxy-beta-dihydromenaquinone-9 sulfotransferase
MKENKETIQHSLFGISTRNWIKLLKKNKGVDNRYLKRGIFITLSSIFFAPARFLFKIRYDSKIKETKIKHPPVIIVGHWRTGTTYLHELLSQDPQFCSVTLWNTLLPDSFLILNPLKKFLSNFLPKKRPMDEIRVDIDGPYEEEAGIAVLSQWSFFHCLHFPRNAEEQYLKSMHFKGMSKKEIKQWKESYLKFMKTVTYSNNGKRLLLKNPANSTRIPMLLELFPDANFIHIYRNPYKVYLSTIKMRNRVLDKLALQNASKSEIENQVIENYKRVMNSLFKDIKKIPKNKIVEVRYEDLVADPKKQVKKIYEKLNLPGLEKAIPEMNKYLEMQKDYKVNVYKIDKKILDRVKENWNFTIDLWNYKPPK